MPEPLDTPPLQEPFHSSAPTRESDIPAPSRLRAFHTTTLTHQAHLHIFVAFTVPEPGPGQLAYLPRHIGPRSISDAPANEHVSSGPLPEAKAPLSSRPRGRRVEKPRRGVTNNADPGGKPFALSRNVSRDVDRVDESVTRINGEELFTGLRGWLQNQFGTPQGVPARKSNRSGNGTLKRPARIVVGDPCRLVLSRSLFRVSSWRRMHLVRRPAERPPVKDVDLS